MISSERRKELNKAATVLIRERLREIYNERIIYQLVDMGGEEYAYLQTLTDKMLANCPVPPEYLEE